MVNIPKKTLSIFICILTLAAISPTHAWFGKNKQAVITDYRTPHEKIMENLYFTRPDYTYNACTSYVYNNLKTAYMLLEQNQKDPDLIQHLPEYIKIIIDLTKYKKDFSTETVCCIKAFLSLTHHLNPSIINQRIYHAAYFYFGKYVDLLEYILLNGSPVNLSILEHILCLDTRIDSKDDHGNTILHNLAYTKTDETSFTIPEHNNAVLTTLARYIPQHMYDMQNNNGETALHTAVAQKNINLIKWLVENRANTTIKNSLGFTPFQIARSILEEHIDINYMQVTQNGTIAYSPDEIVKLKAIVYLLSEAEQNRLAL
jgi:hypothetical protein